MLQCILSWYLGHVKCGEKDLVYYWNMVEIVNWGFWEVLWLLCLQNIEPLGIGLFSQCFGILFIPFIKRVYSPAIIEKIKFAVCDGIGFWVDAHFFTAFCNGIGTKSNSLWLTLPSALITNEASESKLSSKSAGDTWSLGCWNILLRPDFFFLEFILSKILPNKKPIMAPGILKNENPNKAASHRIITMN